MVTKLKRFCKSTIYSILLLYRAVIGADHKILNHYILKISQMQDIDSIIYQAARCLHYLLNYRLFCFAVYDREYNGGVDIWVDPQIDHGSIMDFIKKDFSHEGLFYNIRHFDSSEEKPVSSRDININNLLSYKVINNQTRAVLYLLPQRMMLHHHSEILDIIIKTVSTSISNFINMKKLENAALIDPLTHCYNRRALNQYIDHDIANTNRYGSELSIIMFDIDHFKKVNDNHGHKAGDNVLQAVSKSVLSAIRKSDYLARYGGEEFLLVLPETKFSKAIELADRLRKILENLKIDLGEKTLNVTASFGVAALKKGKDKNDLFETADNRLYKAKMDGRNRIKPDLRIFQNYRPVPQED